MTRRDDWRIGAPERDAVAEALAGHYAAGRLSTDEFHARLDAAFAATTARGLAGITADLPAAPARQAAWAPGAAAWAPRRRRSWGRSLARLTAAGLVLFLATVVLAVAVI